MGISNYCPLKFDKTKLKFIGDTLTKTETKTVKNKISSSCGGFLLDADIFKLEVDKNKNKCITLKTIEKITDSLIPNCGGIRLDKAVFNINNNEITLIEQIERKNDNSKSKVIFDSIEDFTIQVTKDGNIVYPISNKEYELEKGITYQYEANNSKTTVKGTITPKRKNNITETITF